MRAYTYMLLLDLRGAVEAAARGGEWCQGGCQNRGRGRLRVPLRAGSRAARAVAAKALRTAWIHAQGPDSRETKGGVTEGIRTPDLRSHSPPL